jgi:hypothetical protein
MTGVRDPGAADRSILDLSSRLSVAPVFLVAESARDAQGDLQTTLTKIVSLPLLARASLGTIVHTLGVCQPAVPLASAGPVAIVVQLHTTSGGTMINGPI